MMTQMMTAEQPDSRVATAVGEDPGAEEADFWKLQGLDKCDSPR